MLKQFKAGIPIKLIKRKENKSTIVGDNGLLLPNIFFQSQRLLHNLVKDKEQFLLGKVITEHGICCNYNKNGK